MLSLRPSSLSKACWHADLQSTIVRSFRLFKHFNIMRGADETAEPDAESMRNSNTRSDLYIEARLHPKYVSVFLDLASTPQVRNALLEGLPANDALHRLRICESRAARGIGPDSPDDAREEYDVLREEGQQWWRECSLEVERRERLGAGP